MGKMIGLQKSIDVLTKYLPAPKSSPIFNHDARNLELLNRMGKPANLSWQDLYWGSNLPRLRQIKAKYDANNVFQCRDCLTLDGSHDDSGNKIGDTGIEKDNNSVVDDNESTTDKDTTTSSAPGGASMCATATLMFLGNILVYLNFLVSV